MKRRSKVGGERAKTRRPIASKSRRGASNQATRSTPSVAGEQGEIARLGRELKEAREQQTATAGVLRMISGFPSDVQSVLEAIVRMAGRLCEAEYALLFRLREGKYHLACSSNAEAEFVKFSAENPISVNRGSLVGRTALARQAVHIEDCLADPEYKLHAAARLGRHRTMLGVPLLQGGQAVGVIGLLRTVAKPFTEKQIELVTTFAAQAVIAIENARLVNELRQRTADLTDALDRQTASSEVLHVISSSPGELEPVFAAMLDNAVRICGANFGNLFLYEDDVYRAVAMHNAPEAYANLRTGGPIRPSPENALGRLAATKDAVQIADLMLDDAYKKGTPLAVSGVEQAGIRTLLAVPMLKDDKLQGAIVIYRQEVRAFNDKQIELVKNFAAQAVIAIENARLLTELRQSLGQQTATADVLKVISRSTFDLHLVLDTLIETAARLCGAKRGVIFRRDGDVYRAAAFYNATPDLIDFVRRHPIAPGRHTITARVALERRAIHVADLQEDAEYTYALRDTEPIRTELGVPMFRGDDIVGVFILYKLKVEPFTDKQVELVTTFADQAVIAIENVRLLNELRERTEEVEKLNQQLEQRVADQVGEIERMSRLRRFLPPQVADLIVASGSEKQLESHRREITALFCDLRGFTGFTESADAEDVMALLRDYHAAIGEIIIKYNGTLERYAGDGVMVVFNDPVPAENPALQAVLMALELRDALGALTATWSRLGHEIGFGIGIAHGFATLGTIGFEGRFDYAAIGTVSNVASRLCDEAKPGQILISPRVLMKVENVVKVEPVGEFDLKGIRRPLAAYNVVGAAQESN
jgi:GAF domain-containing protein